MVAIRVAVLVGYFLKHQTEDESSHDGQERAGDEIATAVFWLRRCVPIHVDGSSH